VSFLYDTLDRRTGIVYGAESNVKYFYDKVGRVTNLVDSVAGTISLTYDSLDRLTQELNSLGLVNYSYNDVGLRTNMTVVGESAIGYSYDAANRLTNVTQSGSSSTLFYDDAGRRTKLTLPNGINTLYFYDTASRLTNITYQAATTNKIDYAYDQVGSRVAQASLLAVYNLPAAVSGASYNAANQQLVFGSYSMLYDASGNVTNILNGGSSQNLLWNNRNQLTNITGSVAGTFKYDGLGRRVENTVSGTATKFVYDGLDPILEKNSGNTIVTRYLRGLAIDEPWQRGELTFVGESGPTSGLRGWWKMNEGTGTTAADSSGNGNTGTLTGGPTWSSGIASNAVVLDGVNDYVNVGDSATLENNATFTFAAWINPDQFFSSRDNYLMHKEKVLRWGFLSATSRQPTVDIGSGSGNPGWQGASTSSTQINSNEWTHLSVTYTNSTVKFYVNGLLTDSITKTYTMGSNNKAYSLSTATQAFDGKLDDVRYYNRALSDSEVSQVYGEQSTNRVYMADALGSIVALTDSAKAIQTEYDYQPFGKSTSTGTPTPNPYSFTGREDDGTGLMYYRARYYHPVLGRFIGEDPLEGDGGGLNLFAYVLNDPINWFDSDGLDAEHTKGKRPSTHDKHTAGMGRPKCGARPGNVKPNMAPPPSPKQPYVKPPMVNKGPKAKLGGAWAYFFELFHGEFDAYLNRRDFRCEKKEDGCSDEEIDRMLRNQQQLEEFLNDHGPIPDLMQHPPGSKPEAKLGDDTEHDVCQEVVRSGGQVEEAISPCFSVFILPRASMEKELLASSVRRLCCQLPDGTTELNFRSDIALLNGK